MATTTLTRSGTELLDGVRGGIATHANWSRTAELVADQLRLHLPSPDVLTAEQRLGCPDNYCSHTLHVEPDGMFSIIAVVWRPGQLTRIHDHVTWCVVGVIQGIEHEELFDENLTLIRENENRTGDVSGFAPRLRRGPRRGGGALRASAHRPVVEVWVVTLRFLAPP